MSRGGLMPPPALANCSAHRRRVDRVCSPIPGGLKTPRPRDALSTGCVACGRCPRSPKRRVGLAGVRRCLFSGHRRPPCPSGAFHNARSFGPCGISATARASMTGVMLHDVHPSALPTSCRLSCIPAATPRTPGGRTVRPGSQSSKCSASNATVKPEPSRQPHVTSPG